ncbi:MAG TPA: tRNA uracil 4-sulfurtransferase ThiI [Bacillota bacterium]|nr:tRNA uracil 4-sulfurtransferase ThiI [Bacillota bacterium]
MKDLLMIRYGDLILKGRNRNSFMDAVNRLIKEKLAGLSVGLEFCHDRAYVHLNDAPLDIVIRQLGYVTGLYSYSLMSKCQVDFDEIAALAIELLTEDTKGQEITFKVETKRVDKTYPMQSPDISKVLSGMILSEMSNLIVDVHNPKLTLTIEIRKEGAYLFTDQIKGLGGFPIPIAGKAVVLLSGGIDSPVASFLAMKKGFQVELVHFESTPMTSIESAQKVIDLAEILSRYAPHDEIRLNFVPFTAIHEKIIASVPESYIITIMRRMMVRIASGIKEKTGSLAIITGDSIGQVASQTPESLATIQEAINDLVIRPLSTYDKMEIMEVARKIGTLEISNRPFSDCCTVYIPKSPVIRPSVAAAVKYEESFDYRPMIEEAVNKTKTVTIIADKHLDIQSKGLSIKDVLS